jgi:hypothetical protein
VAAIWQTKVSPIWHKSGGLDENADVRSQRSNNSADNTNPVTHSPDGERIADDHPEDPRQDGQAGGH